VRALAKAASSYCNQRILRAHSQNRRPFTCDCCTRIDRAGRSGCLDLQEASETKQQPDIQLTRSDGQMVELSLNTDAGSEANAIDKYIVNNRLPSPFLPSFLHESA
jgi:hypothetical protein